jgi:hypothetical protein
LIGRPALDFFRRPSRPLFLWAVSVQCTFENRARRWINQLSDNTSQPNSKLPAWVAGLAVLLLLAGSAWALYKFVWQDKPAVAVESVPIGPSSGGGRNGGIFSPRGGPPAAPVSQSSVSRSLSGRIRARHGGVVVYGIPKNTGGLDSVLEYEDARNWVTPDQWENQIRAGRPMQYPALAEKIAITPDQKARIEALTYQPPLTSQEKSDFDTLFNNWLKAPQKEKDAAAEELSNAVQSAAQKHLPEAKAALLKRCTEVTTILSAQQMQQIREWFNSPGARTTNVR